MSRARLELPEAYADRWRRGGLLLLNKPSGFTSADTLDALKRDLRRCGLTPKIGHGGTLDRLAHGLLVVLVGPATRWFDLLNAHDKAYIADVDLSAFSTTDDADGVRTVVDSPAVDAGRLADALNAFVGEIDQRPPAFSRVHVGGQRADRRAREQLKRHTAINPAAESAQATDSAHADASSPPLAPSPEQVLPLERPAARRVTIHHIDMLAFSWPIVRLGVTCSKGTYIRSLARDLGERLGTGGMLVDLCRTRIGPLRLDEAIDWPAVLPREQPAAEQAPVGPNSSIDPASPIGPASSRSLALPTGATRLARLAPDTLCDWSTRLRGAAALQAPDGAAPVDDGIAPRATAVDASVPEAGSAAETIRPSAAANTGDVVSGDHP